MSITQCGQRVVTVVTQEPSFSRVWYSVAFSAESVLGKSLGVLHLDLSDTEGTENRRLIDEVRIQVSSI
jgi:hypothetical protein